LLDFRPGLEAEPFLRPGGSPSGAGDGPLHRECRGKDRKLTAWLAEQKASAAGEDVLGRAALLLLRTLASYIIEENGSTFIYLVFHDCIVRQTLRRNGQPQEGRFILHDGIDRALHEMLGLGVLEIMLSDDEIEEIVVNGSEEPVWVYHKRYGWLRTNIRIETEEEIYNYAAAIGRRSGREITDLKPLMDTHLTLATGLIQHYPQYQLLAIL
jgi:hypothetical protein